MRLGGEATMEVFAPYLLVLAGIVAISLVWAVRNSRKPSSPKHDLERRQERLMRQQENFYRQQSWRFWRDMFHHR